MANQNIPVTSNGNVQIDCDNDNNNIDKSILFSHNNGAELMRIQEDGKVGINQTAPDAILEIRGKSPMGDYYTFRVTDSDRNNKFVVKDTGRIEFGWDGRAAGSNGGPSVIMVPSPLPAPYASTNRLFIQHAINQAEYNGGGTVILQKGTYYVDKVDTFDYSYGILLKRGVRLVGSSAGGTSIVSTMDGASEKPLYVIRVQRYDSGSHIPVYLENLGVSGNSGNYVTGIHIGHGNFDLDRDVQPAFVENVHVWGCDGTNGCGIMVSSWFTELNNCKVFDCTTGIRLFYPNSPYDNQTTATGIYHCQIWNVNVGIEIRGVNNQIIGCNIGEIIDDNCCGIRIVGQSSFSNYICGNYIEKGPTGSDNAIGIKIESRGNTVIGNYFDLTPGKEISLESGIEEGNVLIGNFNGPSTSLKMCLCGKVGIGTTDPSFQLDVRDSVNQAQAIFGKGRSGDSQILIGEGLGNDKLLLVGMDASNGYAYLHTYGTAKGNGLVLKRSGTNGGSVGIGTTSPARKLHVKDSNKQVAQIESTAVSNLKIDVCVNNGTPNAVITALRGSLCVDITNAKLYINNSGTNPGDSGTSWVLV